MAAAEIAALAVEEERLANEARERARAREEKRAKTEDPRKAAATPEPAETGWSATAILRGLAKLRAKERSAAEDLIRKARETGDEEPAGGSNPESEAWSGGQSLATAPVRAMWAPAHGAAQVWYFTTGGTRCGPVTFGELRAMAASRVLDPRLDLVWKEGMEEWKQAGLLDGLFERRAVPAVTPEVRGRKTGKTVAALPKDLTAALASKQMHWDGVGRLVLWLGLLLVPLLWGQLLGWSRPTLVARLGSDLMSKVLPFESLVPAGIVAWLVLKRLVNLGMSRGWAFLLVIPVVNLWVCYRCLVCPPGFAHHRKLDRYGMGVALAVLAAIPAVWYLKVEHPGLLSPARVQTELHRWLGRAGKLISPR